MSIIKYDKLVRDKIPQIIQADGKIPTTHIADDREYWQKLVEKLKEETNEFSAEDSNMPDELADLLEIIYAICGFKNITLKDLEKIREEKAKKRGGFIKRFILEKVES